MTDPLDDEWRRALRCGADRYSSAGGVDTARHHVVRRVRRRRRRVATLAVAALLLLSGTIAGARGQARGSSSRQVVA
jgi:hypothetical protein